MSRSRRHSSALALLLAALGLAAGSLAPSAAEAIRPAPRAGIDIRFANIDGQSGMEGQAFLILSNRRTSVTQASDCAGAVTLRAVGMNPRAFVRRMELEITAPRDHRRPIPIRESGCPRASFRAELADDTEADGGEGQVRLEGWPSSPGALIRARYRWTVTREDAPFPFRGSFVVRQP